MKLNADRQRLINRFYMIGLCNKTGFPKEIPCFSNCILRYSLRKPVFAKQTLGLSCLEPKFIVERYNAILRGYAEFYLNYINSGKLSRWIYILRHSCLKTFAQKYKTSIKGIFRKFGIRLHSRTRQTIRLKTQIKWLQNTFQKTYTFLTYKDLVKIMKKSKEARFREKDFGTSKRVDFLVIILLLKRNLSRAL